MPVKIRLTRTGRKKQPSYRVVVMDSRKQRDAEYIEQVGFYDPRQDPSFIEINNDRAVAWLQQGAQPTDRAKKLLEISGAWTQFKVARGDVHIVGDAPKEPSKKVDVSNAAPVMLDDIQEEAAAEPVDVVEDSADETVEIAVEDVTEDNDAGETDES
jgi:small subunit ribosomal protein S16